MMTIIACILSVIAVIMSFFEAVRLPAFLVAIFAIIFGVIAGYQKEKPEEAKEEKVEKKDKKSVALEVGSIIVSGAVCVSYLVILYVS